MFLKLLLLSDEFSFNYEGLSTSPSRIASGIRLISSCRPPPGVSESATFDIIQPKIKINGIKRMINVTEITIVQ